MKVCDRCEEKLPPDFMQIPNPCFLIYKYKNGINTEISLCASCSKELNNWLNNKKEYKPKVILDPEYGDADWYCGNCGELIDIEYDSYCPSCGGKIKENE